MAITYRGTDPDGDLTNDEMDSNFETCEQRYEGSSIASAAALALTADYNYFTVSGNTNISSMTNVHVGHQVTLKFDAAGGALVHGTSLLMPGNSTYTWEAGDTAILVQEASGVYRCIQYLPYRVWDTAITQSADDASEKKATTAYTDTAMAAGSGSWSHIATLTTSATTLGETTAIPAGCTRIRINCTALSLNAAGTMYLLLSNSATYTGLTYSGGQSLDNSAEIGWTAAAAFVSTTSSSDIVYGIIELEKMSASSDIWIITSRMGEDSSFMYRSTGLVDLPGELDRLKITSLTAFDGGSAFVEAYVP